MSFVCLSMMELCITVRELRLDFAIRRVRCALFSIALAACLFRVEVECNEGVRKNVSLFSVDLCVSDDLLRILYQFFFSAMTRVLCE